MISEWLAIVKLEKEGLGEEKGESPEWISCNYSIVTAASDCA